MVAVMHQSEVNSILTANSSPLQIERRGSDTTLYEDPLLSTEKDKSSKELPDDFEKQILHDSDHDPNLVRWSKEDVENPKNWSMSFRAFCTIQLGLLAFTSSMASSITSPAAKILSKQFDVPQGLMTFNISLYVLGFAFGPLFWAGISETFGRRWSLLPPIFTLAIFSIGSATANTPEALFIARFFGGLFGSAPMTNAAAALGDLYHPTSRSVAMSVYTLGVNGGPCIGPIIGSIFATKITWRWSEYLIAILAFSIASFSFFFLPETFENVLLKKRAIKLRKETGNEKLYHPHENVELDCKTILTKQITRPLRFLITEPIVIAISIYASFIYSLVYMSLQIVPIIFIDTRGWDPIVGTLPFLAIFVGILIALAINLGNIPFYRKAVQKNDYKPVPEARLPPMLIGTILFSFGLFWIGWTADPKYSWVLPVLGLSIFGAGLNTSFQQTINFLVDSYTIYSASAVAANNFLRSFMAAGLPFATRPMFHALGVLKSLSILGALAAAAIPMPIFFKLYGKKLREKSKFAQI